jgi:hypothetical protein
VKYSALNILILKNFKITGSARNNLTALQAKKGLDCTINRKLETYNIINCFVLPLQILIRALRPFHEFEPITSLPERIFQQLNAFCKQNKDVYRLVGRSISKLSSLGFHFLCYHTGTVVTVI